MADAFDTLELSAALDGDDGAELTITDLPKELLVSVFVAVGDSRWVRHTIPCVCKGWAELYRSQDASPLHERSSRSTFERSSASSSSCRLLLARPHFSSGVTPPPTVLSESERNGAHTLLLLFQVSRSA